MRILHDSRADYTSGPDAASLFIAAEERVKGDLDIMYSVSPFSPRISDLEFERHIAIAKRQHASHFNSVAIANDNPKSASCYAHESREADVLNVYKADYPEEADGAEGIAQIEVFLDEKGRVQDTLIMRSTGNSALDAAARTAATKSTYQPKCVDGKPVATQAVFRSEFSRQ